MSGRLLIMGADEQIPQAELPLYLYPNDIEEAKDDHDAEMALEEAYRLGTISLKALRQELGL